MADDREVLRELWDGRLPIRFSLASDEVVSMEQPDSIYLMVPRQVERRNEVVVVVVGCSM